MTTDRIGDWCETASGIQFWPLDPRPEDVDLGDIAHALARQCRFSGHCRVFYSVAEHSVRVARCVEAQPGSTPEHVTWGLLHDAAEAYVVDLPRPIKHLPELAHYRLAEAHVMRCICAHFGMSTQEPLRIRLADDTLLATEALDLMPQRHPWEALPPPLPDLIEPWDCNRAEAEFLDLACRLNLDVLPVLAVPGHIVAGPFDETAKLTGPNRTVATPIVGDTHLAAVTSTGRPGRTT